MVSKRVVGAVQVVNDVCRHRRTIRVDLLLDQLFLILRRKNSFAALFQRFPLQLVLGSRRADRQKRRYASLPGLLPWPEWTRVPCGQRRRKARLMAASGDAVWGTTTDQDGVIAFVQYRVTARAK